jgi:hypothetical protein
VKSPVSRSHTGQAVRSVAEDVTEPLAAVGETGRVLPVQIARFGDLAGRDLLARALAARHQRDGRDPRDHGDYQPLSQAERLELRALRAALMSGYEPALPAGPAGGPSGVVGVAGSGSPQSLLRLARLRRPSPPPGPRRAAARHRRPAVTDLGLGLTSRATAA